MPELIAAFDAFTNLLLLQKLGGWASLAMVERYAHARQELAAATQAMVDARDAPAGSPQITSRPVIAKARHP